MDKNTAATFLLCLMVASVVSDAEAFRKHPLKTEALSLVTDSTWGSSATEVTLGGMGASGGTQTTLLYAAHKREMKQRGGGGLGRKLKEKPPGGGFGRKLLFVTG